MAVAFPILPGKTAEWRAWMAELNGPRREEFVESRRRAGVHERTFLQSTPMGDLVIVTLEGDDPASGVRHGPDDVTDPEVHPGPVVQVRAGLRRRRAR